MRDPLLWLLVIVILCLALPASAGKKLIEFGWDVPTPTYLKDHIKEMEQRPFDGVILRLIGDFEGKHYEAYQAWAKVPFAEEAIPFFVEELKAVKFDKFTDNFLLAWSTPGDTDWYSDEEFGVFVQNMRLLARVAKQAGLKGICFDNEPYSDKKPWLWMDQPGHETRSFSEYSAKARMRGRELMKAIGEEYPDITFMTLFGFTSSQNVWDQKPFQKALSEWWLGGLYPAFLNGVIEAMPKGARFLDGHEWGYYYGSKTEFLQGYWNMVSGCKHLVLPQNWKKYREVLSAGFGLYMDRNWRTEPYTFKADDISKNFWSPEAFEARATEALTISDEYVWVYTECLNWWTGDNLPLEYQEALERAKKAVP